MERRNFLGAFIASIVNFAAGWHFGSKTARPEPGFGVDIDKMVKVPKDPDHWPSRMPLPNNYAWFLATNLLQLPGEIQVSELIHLEEMNPELYVLVKRYMKLMQQEASS